MKYIYLDTSHLLKWAHGDIHLVRVIDKLEKIASSGKYLFAISGIHVNEVSNRSGRIQVLNDFDFILKLPSVGILSSISLFNVEISNAHQVFNGKNSLQNPFLNEGAHLSRDDIDRFLLSHAEQQAHHNSLDKTVQDGVNAIALLSKKLDKQRFKRLLHLSFKERIRAGINSSGIIIDEQDEFISFLFNNLQLIPALALNFYSHIFLSRGNKSDKVKINDWFDIEHYGALPYVDYFSLDRESESRLRSIINIANIPINSRFSSNLDVLFDILKN